MDRISSADHMKETQELIGELRGLAHGRLSEKKCEQMLDEVRAHLDESIQARMELAMPRAQAESEAIQAFGDPVEFVEKMSERLRNEKREWFDAKVWRAMACTTLFFAFFFCYVAPHDEWWRWMVVVYLAGVIVFPTWIILTSAKALRPQFLPLVATFLSGLPLCAAFLAIDHIGDNRWDQGIGLTKGQARKEIGENTDAMFTASKAEKDFLAAADRYYFRPSGSTPMSVIWSPSYDMRKPDTFHYVPARTQEEADRAWKRIFPKAYHDLVEQQQATGRGDLELALDQPYLVNAFYFLPTGEEVSQQMVELMAIFSLVSWSVASIGRRAKNRKRPQIASS